MKALPLLMRLVAIAALVLPARPALAARLIVVGPGQPIQPALDRALPGDVVQVEGTHVENVVLRAGVTLRGGKGAILTSGRAPVVRIQGVKGATLESLTIRLTGKPSDDMSLAAVAIGKADATVQRCLVNSCATGVKVSSGAAPQLIGNVLSQCGDGLVFEKDANGEARDNVARNNLDNGISVVGRAAPTIRHNTIEANNDSGIQYFGNAGGKAVDNVIKNNNGAGIEVFASSPSILQNTIETNNDSGINYLGNAGGNLVNNLIRNNKHYGITVAGSSPTIRQNTIETNKESGIFYSIDAGGDAIDNLVRNNKGNGIIVFFAAPTLRKNTLESNWNSGIFFMRNSRGDAFENLARNNKRNGFVVFSATPNLRHNILEANLEHGIAYFGNARGEATDNLSKNNKWSGAVIEGPAAPTLSHNTLDGNEQAGIAYFDKARGEAIANVVHGNQCGIFVNQTDGATSTPRLQQNRVAGNVNDYEGLEPGPTDCRSEITYTDRESFILADADGRPDPTAGWSGPLGARPSDPPRFTVATTLVEPSGNDAIDGEEAANLDVTVRNIGEGPSKRLQAHISLREPVPGLEVPATVEVGDLSPGAEKTVRIPLRASRQVAAGTGTVQIDLVDAFEFDAPPTRVTFQTRAFEAPALVVEQVGTDDGNGNGLLERGEGVDLRVIVANRGGLARQVVARLVTEDSRLKIISDDHVRLGDLAGGTWKQASFSVFVPNRYDGPDRLPLAVRLEEAHPDLARTSPLPVALQASRRPIDERTIQARDTAARARNEAAAPDMTIPEDTPPDVGRRNPDAHAVVIGIERYGDRAPAVPYARRDAAIFREYLVRTFGVPEDHIDWLTDEQATLANMRTALEGKLASAIEEGRSDVYVYFAGHGAPDTRTQMPYLIPADGNPAYPQTSCYPLAACYEALGKLGARSVTVVLDACFSGGTARGERSETLVANARPIAVRAKGAPVPPGVTVFAAADGDQISSGYPLKKHGLYTAFWFRGLRGEADANGDARLTVGELQDYLETRVPREARRMNREQTPVLLGEDRERELVRLR